MLRSHLHSTRAPHARRAAHLSSSQDALLAGTWRPRGFEVIRWMNFALRLAVILSPTLESTLTVHLVAFLDLTLEPILVVRLVVLLGPTRGSAFAGSLVATLARISGVPTRRDLSGQPSA